MIDIYGMQNNDSIFIEHSKYNEIQQKYVNIMICFAVDRA